MAYTKASAAIRIAKEKYDMSYQDIADLCKVSLGSVKRWMMTGRADEKAIQPLLDTVGSVYLTAGQIADHLIQLYRRGPRKNQKGTLVKRIVFTARQLEHMAGRQYLKRTLKDELIEECRERGFLLIKGTDDFVMVSWKWLHDSSVPISDDEIPQFYEDLADSEDDDPDE